VVAVRDTHFVRSFHITNRASAGYDAFIFLKQAATTPTLPNLYPELPPGQTTLGQYFPEAPSRYGPMNYVRTSSMMDFPQIQQQGLVPQDQSGHNAGWDADEDLFAPGEKQFDMTRSDGKGFFLTKPHPRNIHHASTAPKNRQLGTGLVGVRMSPQEMAQMDTQTRTADESPEDLPEMLMHESIPPERLVMMPQSLRTRLGVDQHDPSTRRNRPDKPAVLGRKYGIDANFVDRNAPPDAQGRAFNFDELGEY
jgi:hypothetical protein